MESLVEQVAHLQFLNQFWLSIFFLIPMVLVARAVVAGTRYSPILIIVVFGLAMGYTICATGVTETGMPHFPMIGMLSRTTIVALIATFFVGGQELRRIFGGVSVPKDDSVVYASEEVVLGTGRTHLVFIARAFFILLGLDALTKMILSLQTGDAISRYYPFIAYFCLAISVLLVDNKAKIKDKRVYLRRGLMEKLGILAVLILSYMVAGYIEQWIALPQIFFAMIIASLLGMHFYRWSHGPTIRCLLFAGIPIILAANFLIGGSLITQTFSIQGIQPVLVYGFFGQVLWMFGAMALLMLIGRTAHVRNLAPGMAGALSHAGLTGACTAGDFGDEAAKRAPIMINVPFIGHIFVFSILAISMQRGGLMMLPSVIVALAGVGLTALALVKLRQSKGKEQQEVKALMIFALGWQLTALFGGLLLLAKMSLPYAAMAKSSSLSHFGLFAAVQGGMFGPEVAGLISFVFAMPFLVHPFVFFIFGRAMESGGDMPRKPVYVLAIIGLIGVIYSVMKAGGL